MNYALVGLVILATFLLWQNISLRSRLESLEKKRQEALKRFTEKLSEKLRAASEERKKYVQKLDAGGVASELNRMFEGKDTDSPMPPTPAPSKT